MSTSAQDIASIPALFDLPAAELAATAAWWAQRELDPGRAIWEEGSPADGLGLLIRGELAVESQGVVVGEIHAGEVLGESSAVLTRHTRTATLRALTHCSVLTLRGPQLVVMRTHGGPVYDALLDLAERTLVRRIHDTDLRIAQTAAGNGVAPVREKRSALVRIWNAIRPGLPATRCPPVEPLLWLQPGMSQGNSRLIAAIAKGFIPEAVPAGTVLFLEGEAGAAAWLIAEGRVDVWRNVGGGQAERLATLGAGRLIGVNALIERAPRAASCVTTTPCWLYRMDGPAGFRHLRGVQRQAWRESLLGTLTSQLRTADEVLAACQRASPTPADLPSPVGLDVDAPPGDRGEGELLIIEPILTEEERSFLWRTRAQEQRPTVL